MFENNQIIYLSLFCIILYLVCDKNIERMSEVSTDAKIKGFINTIYKADVQAIRNLSDIAQKLQGKNGKDVILPGNFTIEGSLKVGKDTTVSGITRLNKDLNVTGNSTVSGSSRVSGSSTVSRNSTVGGCTVKGALTVGGSSTVNGNSTIKGDTYTNTRLLTNKVRYIQVGNTKSDMRRQDNTHVWHPSWAITLLTAYDENGTLVSNGKPVKRLAGTPQTRWGAPSVITNNKIDDAEAGTYHNMKGQSLLEIDLGREYYIKNIVLICRWWKPFTEHQHGTHIQTFNQARKSINLVHFGNSWNDLTKHIEF